MPPERVFFPRLNACLGWEVSLNPNLWFKPQSLLALTDTGTWSRGLMLFRHQKVLSLRIQPAGKDWVLLGNVQGSQSMPYEVAVDLSFSADGIVSNWNSDCECPVGSQCKHAIGLMLEAAHRGIEDIEADFQSSLPVTRTSEQIEAERLATEARIESIAQAAAERELLGWLADMDRANGFDNGTGNLAASANRLQKPAERAEQYLYLLSLADTAAKPRLHISVVTSYRKANGDWAKPRPLRRDPYRMPSLLERATPADREVLQLLSGMIEVTHYRGYSYDPRFTSAVQGRSGLIALELAAGTGRLFMNNNADAPGQAMQWGAALEPHWSWQEVAPTQIRAAGWALRAEAPQTGVTVCYNQPPLYIDVVRGECGCLQATGIPAAQLDILLKSPVIKKAVLQKHQLGLMQRLGGLPAPPGLKPVTTVQGVTPQACLHLSAIAAADQPQKGLVEARLRFDYQGHRGWWTGRGGVIAIDTEAGTTLLHRDVEAELDAITRLSSLGLRVIGQGLFGIPADQSQQLWLRWADDGFTVLREAGFVITHDTVFDHWIQRAETLSVQLQAQDGDEATSPWFDLSLGMEINGERHNILPCLPGLIAQAAASPLDPATGQPRMPPYVYLHAPDGSGFIRLPTEAIKPWMAALLELVGEREHQFSGDSLKLSRLDALRASAALGAGAVWEGAQSLREMLHQLGGREALAEVPVPASVKASLRPYQQQGVNWLQFLRQYNLGGILADDMGLGKTLQTLVHIQVEKDAGRLDRPALIIAPVSLMGNWQREAARFCPQLRTLVLHGKERHGLADHIDAHDVIIAPYSLLQRDRELWLETQWHLVVLDEAQNIKNASTHAAQVVSQLQTRQRLCLSGTPMENHLGEIWSLFHFLMPGFLGSQKRFATLFRTPIEKQGNLERMDQLRARVTPFMLRRTKAVVAVELPPKVETVMRVELSGKQADLYETIRLGMEKTVRDALNTRGLAKSQITILDALLKLRQVCCDPQLLPLASAKKIHHSAKLEQLMEMLPEMLAEGRRILLFSQFTSMLTLIEAELEQRGLPWVKLTGQSQKRDELIERFTSGAVPLFLISLKAGGTGLNLPQADTVIHYDPWWNPAVERQATDRAHRIGQTESVWVVKLVAQGTIEERILALQERKAALADSMYSGAAGRKQPLFTESDLAELLKPLSED